MATEPTDEEKFIRNAEKLRTNAELADVHEEMTPLDIIDFLNKQGEDWRVVWESIPTDSLFDNLYSENTNYDAFLYKGAVYEMTDNNPFKWNCDVGVLEWLLENPPFIECKPLSELYEFSKNMEAGKRPWLLFQYVIGVAVTSQGMGLNSLMGIGAEESMYLGHALEKWGTCNDANTIYLELLLEYGAE